MRLPLASKRRLSRARGLGPGVSGWESRWRICGGRVRVVIVDGALRGVWRTEDFRREEMRSFTVGAASLSVWWLAEWRWRRGRGAHGLSSWSSLLESSEMDGRCFGVSSIGE